MSDGSTRVLFVDDNSGLLESLRLRFELEADLECVGTLTSAEGLMEAVESAKPDVVVLDVEMPGPDPFAAAAALRPPTTEARAIFLSAYVRDEYIARAVDAGAWGYMGKSEDVEVIINCIRKVVRGEFALSPRARKRCRIAPEADRR